MRVNFFKATLFYLIIVLNINLDLFRTDFNVRTLLSVLLIAVPLRHVQVVFTGREESPSTTRPPRELADEKEHEEKKQVHCAVFSLSVYK